MSFSNFLFHKPLNIQKLISNEKRKKDIRRKGTGEKKDTMKHSNKKSYTKTKNKKTKQILYNLKLLKQIAIILLIIAQVFLWPFLKSNVWRSYKKNNNPKLIIYQHMSISKMLNLSTVPSHKLYLPQQTISTDYTFERETLLWTHCNYKMCNTQNLHSAQLIQLTTNII